MAGQQAQQQPAARQPSSTKTDDAGKLVFTDGKLRIFLYVQGEAERDLALNFLAKYADDDEDPSKPITVQKTNEIMLSDLNRDCVIIPVIRNINRDRRETQSVEGEGDKIRFVENKSPVFECSPVLVEQFMERVADATGRNRRDTLDENALVRAVAAACVVNRHALAGARVEPRSDGHMRVDNWLVLRWG